MEHAFVGLEEFRGRRVRIHETARRPTRHSAATVRIPDSRSLGGSDVLACIRQTTCFAADSTSLVCANEEEHVWEQTGPRPAQGARSGVAADYFADATPGAFMLNIGTPRVEA